jgi:Do/DeqQ family serine protease
MSDRPLKINAQLGGFLATLMAAVLFQPIQAFPASEYPRETAVVRAVRKASPTVVNISLQYEVRKQFRPFSDFGNPLFEEFFKDFFDPGFESRTQRSSLGSGVIIDGKRGFVLTNAHVVEKTGTVSVVLNDEREFTAQIVGTDPDSDLAVLRIDSPDRLPSLDMGTSDDLMIGETVIAIGNPFGFSNTVTTGVISAVDRSFRSKDRVFRDFIQTDASINPGNSGGPLLNINGELIGINTAIYAGAQGIGFAIPISKARRITSDLIAHGEVVAPWIGLRVQDMDDRLREYFGLKSSQGVMVHSVYSDSPAEKAGMKEGDIVLSVEGRSVHSIDDHYAWLRDRAAGEPILLGVWRNGKSLEITVQSRPFPMSRASELAYDLLGVRVEDVRSAAEEPAAALVESGVIIVEIRSDAQLARTGVRPGDVIRQINDRGIAGVQDFEKAVVRLRNQRSIVVLLQRHQQRFYITVEL